MASALARLSEAASEPANGRIADHDITPAMAEAAKRLRGSMTFWGDSSVRNTPHLILWNVREYFRHNMDIDYERRAYVYVLKAPDGRTGVVQLEFEPERVRFLDAPEIEEVHVP